MDIPDIDLVIMYGALGSVNQLHQVVCHTRLTWYMYIILYSCVLLISFVVVLAEEGVKLEHTSSIVHVKGAK